MTEREASTVLEGVTRGNSGGAGDALFLKPGTDSVCKKSSSSFAFFFCTSFSLKTVFLWSGAPIQTQRLV